MTREEILNIVNEPSKHIQIVKIDGKDSIVYSSNFVELLELIPTMSTKDDMMAMLDKIRAEIEELKNAPPCFDDMFEYKYAVDDVLAIIDKYKAESEVKE